MKGQTTPGYVSGSQLGRLRDEAAKSGLKHGDRARVRVDNVNASPHATLPAGTARFCNSRVTVLELLERGDGQEIPKIEAEVLNLGDIPESESFSMEGIFHSNGRV